MTTEAFEEDDELTVDQKNDLRILFSLRGKDEIREWMNSVDDLDFQYGMSLMEIAILKELERETKYHNCIDAKRILATIMEKK